MNKPVKQFAKLGEKIFRELAEEVDDATLAQLLKNKEKVREVMRKALSREETGKIETKCDVLKVKVDYDRTVEEMVKDGNYKYVSSGINSQNFPINHQPSGKVDVCLVHFGRVITSEIAIQELDKMGLRPGKLPELLALGAQYPDLQKEFFIVALGCSVWKDSDGRENIPVLWGDAGDRNVSFERFDHEWSPRWLFVALRLRKGKNSVNSGFLNKKSKN